MIFYFFLNQTFRIVDISLSDNSFLDTESQLSGDEDIDRIMQLNEQFQDMTEVRKTYPQLTSEFQEKLKQDLIAHYLKSVDWAKKETDITFEIIDGIYHRQFGTKLGSLNLTNSSTNVAKLKITSLVCAVLFIGVLVGFLVALGYFLFVVKHLIVK